MSENVLVLAQATPGDTKFYDRWKQIGFVSRRAIEKHPDNHIYTVLVVDFRFTFNRNDPTKGRIFLDIDDFKGVKWVCSATTGEDHLTALKGRGIQIVTLKGETDFLSKNITSVSEFTLQMMLCLSRPIDGMGVVLRHKTVGIIGLGRIGKHVLERCKAFKMYPITYDKGDSTAKLEVLLRESDYVTVHLPLTEETRHFLRRYHFSLMKHTSAFINTARGGVVDERALAWALREGRIAAAAVDVVDNPAILSQKRVPNLVVTPHIAGSTLEDRIATDEFIVKKLRRLMRAH